MNRSDEWIVPSGSEEQSLEPRRGTLLRRNKGQGYRNDGE